MKKIFFFLMLIFVLRASHVYSQDFAINNPFQEKLKMQLFVKNFQKTEDSLLQENAEDKNNFIFEDNTISGKIFLESKDELKKFWVIRLPNGFIQIVDFSKNFIAKNSNNKYEISLDFKTELSGEYSLEIWNTNGEKIFEEKIFIKSDIKNIKDSIWEIFHKIQSLRLLQNSAIIKYDLELQEIAIKKAIDMAEKKYIWHKTPEGKDIFSFVKNNKKYIRLAENVAWGNNTTFEKLYIALLNSPNHYSAIVSPDWKKMGMAGVIYDKQLYLVQVFSD